MQRCNVMVRVGGLMTNTVPKLGVTPAEILVLQHIHGTDAVVDVRPTKVDNRIRQEEEYNRLSATYDHGSGAFVSRPGEEREGVMAKLFPGALKKLPTTLEEIGMGDIIVQAPAEPAPPLPDVDDEEPDTDDTTDDDDAPVATATDEAAGSPAAK